jgi:hypothetical protein
MNDSRKKLNCPCCGFLTLTVRYDWSICPVCFWEDDVVGTDVRDPLSPANNMRLSEGQKNYRLYGACRPDMVIHVRAPKPDEPKDPDWKPKSNV